MKPETQEQQGSARPNVIRRGVSKIALFAMMAIVAIMSTPSAHAGAWDDVSAAFTDILADAKAAALSGSGIAAFVIGVGIVIGVFAKIARKK